jgi:hypothetical protein
MLAGVSVIDCHIDHTAWGLRDRSAAGPASVHVELCRTIDVTLANEAVAGEYGDRHCLHSAGSPHRHTSSELMAARPTADTTARTGDWWSD